MTPRSSDHYESRLRRTRTLKNLAYMALTAGGTWLVVESVRALSLF